MLTRSGAIRKSKRRKALRDKVSSYDDRTKLGQHVKAWTKEDMDKYDNDRKYRGQTSSNLYRKAKRKIRDLKKIYDLKYLKPEVEDEKDEDDEFLDYLDENL